MSRTPMRSYNVLTVMCGNACIFYSRLLQVVYRRHIVLHAIFAVSLAENLRFNPPIDMDSVITRKAEARYIDSNFIASAVLKSTRGLMTKFSMILLWVCRRWIYTRYTWKTYPRSPLTPFPFGWVFISARYRCTLPSIQIGKANLKFGYAIAHVLLNTPSIAS